MKVCFQRVLIFPNLLATNRLCQDLQTRQTWQPEQQALGQLPSGRFGNPVFLKRADHFSCLVGMWRKVTRSVPRVQLAEQACGSWS